MVAASKTLSPEEAFEKSRTEILGWQKRHKRNVIGYVQWVKYLSGKTLTMRERIWANGFSCNEDAVKDCVSPCAFDVMCPYHIHYKPQKNPKIKGRSKEDMDRIRPARFRTVAVKDRSVQNGKTLQTGTVQNGGV